MAPESSPPVPPRCVHCKRNKAQKGRRNLCASCYDNREIRVLFPRKHKSDPLLLETMEDVERLIAQQMKNLPPWWDADTEQQRIADTGVR